MEHLGSPVQRQPGVTAEWEQIWSSWIISYGSVPAMLAQAAPVKCFGACPACRPPAAWWHQLGSAWIQLHPAQAPSWTPGHGGLTQSLLELSPEGANSQLDPNQLCNWIKISTAWAPHPLRV